MATLPPGGGRRTASLGTGSSRSRTVVTGASGRGVTIPTPITEGVGSVTAFALVTGVSDFDLEGDALLLETGDQILLETSDRLLIEDAASAGSSTGTATVTGVGGANVDRLARTEGFATVTGVMEVPNTADNILLEDGDDLLIETGDFILLEDGTVTPPSAILDTLGDPILDTSGDFILEV